ncbi:MAG: hypothetical protein LQ350_004211 [Teloschistes chrysophthalmus]|nr:MAG: hypothetical protein LQ350_004211 [Niorma chrysophthalma]
MPFTSSSTSHPSLPPPPGPPPTGSLPELPSEASGRDPSPTPNDVAQLYDQHSWPTLDVASLKEKLESVAGSSDGDATEACDEDDIYDGDVEPETEEDSQNRVLTQGLEVGTTETKGQDWVLTPDPRFHLAQDLAGLNLPAKVPSDKATANSPLNLQRDYSDEELEYQTASEGEGVGGSLGVKQQPPSKISDDSDDEDYAQAYESYGSKQVVQSMNLQEWTRYTERPQSQPLTPVSRDGNKETKNCHEPSDYVELMPLLEWVLSFRLRTERCHICAQIKLTKKSRVKDCSLAIVPEGARVGSTPTCMLLSMDYKKCEYPAELAPFVEWAKGLEMQMRARSIDIMAFVGEDCGMISFEVKAVDLRSKKEKVWIKEQDFPHIRMQNNTKPSTPSVSPVHGHIKSQTEEANKIKETSLLLPAAPPPSTESQTEEANKVKKTSRLLPQ